jgi:glycosyltransferase involved in cell wall biosynthesis
MVAVSIVMPNLNKGPYVRSAIESVLSQTYSDYELIIVDNGSEDESLTIMAEYSKDARVVLLKEHRKGAGNARNTGIKHARGDVVAFLDADDIYHKDKLLKQVNLFKDPDCHVCYANSWIIDQSGAVTGKIYNRDVARLPTDGYEGDVFRQLLRSNFIMGPSVIVRKECLRREPFDQKLFPSEDWDLWVRLSRNYRFRYIPEPLYGYRMYAGNFKWTRQEKFFLQNQIDTYEKWLRIFGDLDHSDSKFIEESLRNSYMALWNSCVASRDRRALLGLALRNRYAASLFIRRLGSSFSYRLRGVLS